MSSLISNPTRWILKESSEDRVRELARQLQVQPLVARVLLSRGYGEASAAQRFLHPSLDHLHDPFRLKDMDRAIERLHQAIVRHEKILLYGDYDVDGTTSVVILKKALELLGASVDFFVPHRMRDGYGMRPEVIGRASSDGVKLVISVDTGIRAGAVVEHATALGIDVIITDHHLPDKLLPEAVAVINPNRPDCGYPEKNLCGAGVAFKLVQGILTRFNLPADRIARLTDSFLKLVAVATVADVVPLTGENRVIVKRGLEGFTAVRNPGLRALLQVAGFGEGDCPSAGQVAFRIAPRINAAGRMANASDVIHMFLTEDEERARKLAAELHELNKERQDTEAEIVKFIVDECARVPVTDADSALVFCGKGWHRGVVGIVASRIVERYHRPVFVLSEDEETGQVQGSGRSISAFHLLEALEQMPMLFSKFGGHRQAAGVTLDAERVAEFRERLNGYASTKLTSDDFRATLEIDAVLELPELNERAASEVLALAPFGCGNPAPAFAVLKAEIAGPVTVRKEKLVQIPLKQNGRTVFVKSWNLVDRIEEFTPGTVVDAAICIEDDPLSASRGYPGWCAWVKDIRRSAAGASA